MANPTPPAADGQPPGTGPSGASGRLPRGTRATSRRRVYRIGQHEFHAVMPVLILAGLWVTVIYGLIIYESLFQLPLLAPVK